MNNYTNVYYSNTNKLQSVTGSGTQYNYDQNGNMKKEDINRNREIKCNYGNMIPTAVDDQIVTQ